MKKLLGLMILDSVFILVPFLNNVSETMVWWVGSFLVTINIVAAISAFTDDNFTTKYIDRDRPKWWESYDIFTDLLLILSWASIQRYEVGVTLVIFKAALLSKTK